MNRDFFAGQDGQLGPRAPVEWARQDLGYRTQCLRRAGVVLDLPTPHAGNLLPLLRADTLSAMGAGAGRDRTRDAAYWQQVLEQQTAAGARLTWEVSDSVRGGMTRWVGARLVWWACGMPPGRPVAMVSSRLGRPLDTRRSWFAALRAGCRSIDTDCEYVVTVDQTAADRVMGPAAALYGLPLLRVHLAAKRESVAAWLLRCLDAAPVANDGARGPVPWHAFVSASLGGDPMAEFTLRDRLLIAFAQRMFICHVRRRGLVQQLLNKRLTSRVWPSPPTTVAVGDKLVHPRILRELLELGGKPLNIGVPAPRLAETARLDRMGPANSSLPMILPIERFSAAEPYLLHCTRHQIEPWPDQDENEYLEDLILDLPSADHSAFATLQRIVRQQRLHATCRTIRGGYAMVSFTAVQLAELGKLRTYRAHRTRWDFQPYGMGIARRWLRRHGARPVTYGAPALWDHLPPVARPFFQARRPASEHAIDWSREREWRHPGDVRLDSLRANQAFLFVPSQSEADRLAPFSRWPIVVVASSEAR